MSITIAKTAVSAARFSIDKLYDYLVPEELSSRAVPGMRAIVPFGKGNRKTEAVILRITNDSSQKNLKAVDSLPDEAPAFSDEYIRLALWMSDRFFCSVFDAFRIMLPTAKWFKNGSPRLGDKTISTAVLKISGEEAAIEVSKRRSTAPKQAAVLDILANVGSIAVKELCFFAGVSESPVKALEKQGFLSVAGREVYRRPSVRIHEINEPVTLNEEQNQVFEKIARLLKSPNPEAALLFGVTGSGKTLIYIKLIEEVLAQGKTAIVLVPEIALTPQIVSLFVSLFGELVAVLHSALGAGERYDEWKRVSSGQVRVVVGTRSAIFAPLKRIGLIVLDEEQEHTYKSGNSPRYHARDVAKYRVSRSGSLLLLSSATPSIESMYSAETGRYRLFRLEYRYNDHAMPQVLVVDMKQELKNGNGGILSSRLRSELQKNLDCGQQSILFINRRGTNPIVACGECGYTFKCRHCSVSMTFHSNNNRLLCHYCGFSLPLPAECPECGGKLKFIGAGTQKVESELNDAFPGVAIIRMDADTVARVNSHDKLLARFRDGKAQILLGTQMVTKGLDFENVTLVGVISADLSLYMSDFRAQERTFSLITQVVGRSGRGTMPGRAVIQTFTPEHDVIRLASCQDYDGFYKREIAIRQMLRSPPILDLLSISVSGKNEAAVVAACTKLRGALAAYFRGDKGIKLLGPAPAPVPKIQGKYRYRLLLSCENTKTVRNTVAHTIREFSRNKMGRGVAVYAESDPYD